jgi:hypothetical protein
MDTPHAARFVRHAPHFIAPLIFVSALALYLRTTCPTLGGGWDSEEFQHVAYTLGIAHSTGYPLYLSLGKIFTTLAPIGNIAYRMNMLSAILTALAVVFVYLNARLLTQRQLAAIATTALFATNPAVWRQAGVASVGPLNLLLLSALVYALLLWHVRRAPLTIAAFVFGLGLTHHRTVLFLAPAIVLFVSLSDPGIIRRPREWTRALFWLAFPLVLYLYIPIFGNTPPWYVNTLEGFLNYIAGSEAGNYTRGNWLELGQAFVSTLQYLYDSFGVLGMGLVGIGAASILQLNRAKNGLLDASTQLFLGLGVLTYTTFAVFVSGEPDRYLVLPFVFLLYWFAIGAGLVERLCEMILAVPREDQHPQISQSHFTKRAIVAVLLLLVLTLTVTLSFADRFHIADWSAFNRVYKQWDEIFTLPIPQDATIVGSWSQLNAMRYLQRVEQRRLDVQAVGTLYDPAPQTEAARAAFADGRAIFLAPGIAQPTGAYRYTQLGPLLEVRDAPQLTAPAAQKNILLAPSLTLANSEITTALEPYAPTASIAPTRSVRVTFDWQASGSIKDFLVRVRLYDPVEHAILQRDEPPVRGMYPASQWTRGEYVRDVHNIQVPGGTPPGMYTLKMQTLDAQTKSPTSDEISLGTFAVERTTNLTRNEIFIQHPVNIDLGDGIFVWGYGGLEHAYHPGDKLTVSLVWYVGKDVTIDTTSRESIFRVYGSLTEPSHKSDVFWDFSPVNFYPMKEWRKGEVLKAYYDLQIPGDAPTGNLLLKAGFGLSDAVQVTEIPIVP